MDIVMLVDHLPTDHWQKVEGADESEFKSFRLARHIDKKDGSFMYLAQALEGEDDIYQLSITNTKGGDPLRDVQIVQLKIKDKSNIVGILCEGKEGFIRKD